MVIPFIFASENIREWPVFCPEELFAFFIFATVSSVCRELRARLPCLQEVWQATIGEELD